MVASKKLCMLWWSAYCWISAYSSHHKSCVFWICLWVSALICWNAAFLTCNLDLFCQAMKAAYFCSRRSHISVSFSLNLWQQCLNTTVWAQESSAADFIWSHCSGGWTCWDFSEWSWAALGIPLFGQTALQLTFIFFILDFWTLQYLVVEWMFHAYQTSRWSV